MESSNTVERREEALRCMKMYLSEIIALAHEEARTKRRGRKVTITKSDVDKAIKKYGVTTNSFAI